MKKISFLALTLILLIVACGSDDSQSVGLEGGDSNQNNSNDSPTEVSDDTDTDDSPTDEPSVVTAEIEGKLVYLQAANLYSLSLDTLESELVSGVFDENRIFVSPSQRHILYLDRQNRNSMVYAAHIGSGENYELAELNGQDWESSWLVAR